MNRILSLFVLFAFFAVNSLFAATPTITVTLSHFTADFSGAGYVVRLSPVTGGIARRELTDADGLASFTSVTPAIYSLSIEGVGVPTLQIRVPNTADTTAASAIVISAWTPPHSDTTSTTTEAVWQNAAGTIKPTSTVQAINALQFTSSAASDAANVAFIVDSANSWAAGTQLSLRNAGTEFFSAFDIGTASALEMSSDRAEFTLNLTKTSPGNVFLQADTTDDSFDQLEGLWNVSALGDGRATFQLYSTADGYTNEYTADLKASASVPELSLKLDHSGTALTYLNPLVASSGSAVAYTLGTANQLTNSDRVISFQNLGIEQAAIFPTGAIAAGTTNRWKTGAVVTGATVALTLTNYVSITINGVTYKLGLVQ